jgi:hypothetical protein
MLLPSVICLLGTSKHRWKLLAPVEAIRRCRQISLKHLYLSEYCQEQVQVVVVGLVVSGLGENDGVTKGEIQLVVLELGGYPVGSVELCVIRGRILEG